MSDQLDTSMQSLPPLRRESLAELQKESDLRRPYVESFLVHKEARKSLYFPPNQDEESAEEMFTKIDRWGFIPPEEGRPEQKVDFIGENYSVEDSDYRAWVDKEVSRSLKWLKMARRSDSSPTSLNQHEEAFGTSKFEFEESSKFITRVYKGIPDTWRGAAWWWMITRLQNRQPRQDYRVPFHLQSCHIFRSCSVKFLPMNTR